MNLFRNAFPIPKLSHALATVLILFIWQGERPVDSFTSLNRDAHPDPGTNKQSLTPGAEDEFEAMFNQENFDGWYTFIPEFGRNNDPDKVFSIEDGVIHVSGQHFGYLATETMYDNFHLKLEFRWGEKKWPPRLNQKRDSGICYHIGEEVNDEVWPKSIECQIQEGDTGDFWLIGQSTIEVDGQRNEPQDYARIAKKRDTERPNGEWNTVEIITYNGACTHLVNGVVVNHGENASLQNGRIILQSEGAEIDFRNVMIKEL